MQNIFFSLNVSFYTYFVLQNIFKWEIYFQIKPECFDFEISK